MWFWALVLIAAMSVAVTQFTEIYASVDGMKMPVSEFTSQADNLFDKYIGNHLAPFRVEMRYTGDLTAFNASNVAIYSDFISGILIMALCIIGVVIATKRSSNAVSVLGPFWVYSIASLIYVAHGVNSEIGEGIHVHIVWFPCLLSLVAISLSVALACRTIIRHAVNQGWISGIDSDSIEPVQINPEIMNKVNRVAGDILETGTAWTSGKLVGRNIRCCPFCGSSQFTHVKPHPYGSICNSCGRIVGALEEKRGGSEGCPVCPSGLVKGAKFCHRCGTFLENYQIDTISNDGNQVRDNYKPDQPGNEKYEQHDRNPKNKAHVSAYN